MHTMECLSTSNKRAQSHELCNLPPIHTLLTSLSPLLLNKPHTMNGYSGYNATNGLNGPGGPAFSFAPRQSGPPAPVQVPIQARPSSQSIEVSFSMLTNKRLYVKEVLENASMALRAQMDGFPNWKKFEALFAQTGIWLVINWPGYDAYSERIEMGGQQGVRSFYQLLVAVAGVYNNFMRYVKQRNLVCRQPAWSISATSKYDIRNLELVSLISNGGSRFEAKVQVHARATSRMM
ncbi:hypothetical protein C8Q73DRAFT_213097 [Cubamyces lactineus]|nr:hypothetical protein C8Q73DRAFT_213097 [Cubamyces lactineus]